MREFLSGGRAYLAKKREISLPSYILVSGIRIGHLKKDNLSGLAGIAAALWTTLN